MTRVDAPRGPAPKRKRESDAASTHTSTAKPEESTSSASRQHGSGPGAGPVDQAVVEQVRHIARDDPQRREKAYRCFLAHALRKELVPPQASGAAFDALLESTLAQMQADAGLRRDMAQATDILIALADQA